MQKYIISYTPGSCGNFIAGLLYCFQTGIRLDTGPNGSLHKHLSNYYLKIDIDHGPPYGPMQQMILDDRYTIYHTHCYKFHPVILKNDIIFIKIRFKESSEDLIFDLYNQKVVNTVHGFFAPYDSDIYNSVKRQILEFRQHIQLTDKTIEFEDIWTNPNKLLEDISKYTGLPIPSNAIKMISEYQLANVDVYNALNNR